MHIIGLLSAKGGVGKTTAAVNLAVSAAASGRRTLLIDLDPQGAASHLLRIRPACEIGVKQFWKGRHANTESGESGLIRAADHPRLDVLPAIAALRYNDIALAELSGHRRRLETLIRRLSVGEGGWDLVVLDCPPGLGLLSENVIRCADRILVPVPASTLALRTLAPLADLAGPQAHRLRPFLSMARTTAATAAFAQELRTAWPHTLHAIIPASPEAERAALQRQAVAAIAPRSALAKAYLRLWNEVDSALPDDP